MAITYVSNAAVASSSRALPSFQENDLAIILLTHEPAHCGSGQARACMRL